MSRGGEGAGPSVRQFHHHPPTPLVQRSSRVRGRSRRHLGRTDGAGEGTTEEASRNSNTAPRPVSALDLTGHGLLATPDVQITPIPPYSISAVLATVGWSRSPWSSPGGLSPGGGDVRRRGVVSRPVPTGRHEARCVLGDSSSGQAGDRASARCLPRGAPPLRCARRYPAVPPPAWALGGITRLALRGRTPLGPRVG